MRQQTRSLKEPAEKVVRDIRRATRKHYSKDHTHALFRHEVEWIGRPCGAIFLMWHAELMRAVRAYEAPANMPLRT